MDGAVNALVTSIIFLYVSLSLFLWQFGLTWLRLFVIVLWLLALTCIVPGLIYFRRQR